MHRKSLGIMGTAGLLNASLKHPSPASIWGKNFRTETIQQLYPVQLLCSQGIYCLSGFGGRKMTIGPMEIISYAVR